MCLYYVLKNSFSFLISGLLSKLDYFKDQNIGTLLLSAFYKSSDDDAITDHKEIDNQVGTLADFDELLTKLNEKGIIVMLNEYVYQYVFCIQCMYALFSFSLSNFALVIFLLHFKQC